MHQAKDTQTELGILTVENGPLKVREEFSNQVFLLGCQLVEANCIAPMGDFGIRESLADVGKEPVLREAACCSGVLPSKLLLAPGGVPDSLYTHFSFVPVDEVGFSVRRDKSGESGEFVQVPVGFRKGLRLLPIRGVTFHVDVVVLRHVVGRHLTRKHAAGRSLSIR